MRRIMLYLLGAALVLALLPQAAAAQPAAQSGATLLRVMHLSPNAPEISVFIDGEQLFSQVPYAVTSDYREIMPGRHRVQIALEDDDIEESIIDTSIDTIRGRPYTIVVLNTLEELEALALSDSLKSPPPGQARLRVIHAAPGVEAFDIWPVSGEAPFLTDQYFGSADYVNIPAGGYSFDIARAGTSDELLESQELRFEAGWTYTVALTGMGFGARQPFILHAAIDRIAE